MQVKNFISIPFDFGDLEAHISTTPQPRVACILFAPYPPMGGSMSFSLIHDLFIHLQGEFELICRFNYRGVGNSTGTFEINKDGTVDGTAVIKYCLKEYPSIKNISLVGYSYGSAVAYNIHNRFSEVNRFIGISPPFEMFSELFNPKNTEVPKFFMVGTQDQFVSNTVFQEGIIKHTNVNQRMYDNRDHFWMQNQDLIADIQNWVRNTN